MKLPSRYDHRRDDQAESRIVLLSAALVDHCNYSLELHDMGWVAKIGENGRPIAMAIRIGGKHFIPDGVVHDKPEQFTFDALTGEEYPLDFDTYGTRPADIDGDGYDEILRKGEVLDRHGNVIGEIYGIIRGMWKYIDHTKLQILSYKSDGSVRIWVDE